MIKLPIMIAIILSTISFSTHAQQDAQGQVGSAFDEVFYKVNKRSINPEIEGETKHRIFRQGSTGFVSLRTIREAVLEESTNLCVSNGKKLYVIDETTSKPPHILGNFPRVQFVFHCLNDPNSAVSMKIASDKYDQLSKLKVLLDNGTITQTEFDNEKRKILSEQ